MSERSDAGQYGMVVFVCGYPKGRWFCLVPYGEVGCQHLITLRTIALFLRGSTHSHDQTGEESHRSLGGANVHL
ncbi:hypothetical protein [Schaalia sp. lx-100]|uniref:hypothetical protein n=1 Tax=Schaalia sp. lx-100 TaxID=2899081 RepID=UPI001E37777A|nr:hypothetical protein [Schaalia sp. lx-100]MCD4557520.1 hypothetical protein [Schaalia sp. lx-100]